jgi:hypothetical protein
MSAVEIGARRVALGEGVARRRAPIEERATGRCSCGEVRPSRSTPTRSWGSPRWSPADCTPKLEARHAQSTSGLGFRMLQSNRPTHPWSLGFRLVFSRDSDAEGARLHQGLRVPVRRSRPENSSVAEQQKPCIDAALRPTSRSSSPRVVVVRGCLRPHALSHSNGLALRPAATSH